MKERQIILRLVAEGKITPDEAEALLAALDEEQAPDADDNDIDPGGDSGRTGRRRVHTYTSTTSRGRKGTTKTSKIDLSDLEEQMAELGRAVPEVTSAALKGLAKGLGRVRKAATQVKYGVHIDKHQSTDGRELDVPMQAGDCLIMDIPLGDIVVTFADVPSLTVRAKMAVWGSSEEDAQLRLNKTKITVNRQETAVTVGHAIPELKGVGIVWTRDPVVDYELIVPHGVHLRLDTRAGDITVTGQPRGRWELDTRLGDIRLTLEQQVDAAIWADTSIGAVRIELGGKTVEDVRRYRGTFGAGQATVEARTRLGDVTVVTRDETNSYQPS